MPVHDYTIIYKTSPMLMDIIFQVLTTISNHLINILREEYAKKKNVSLLLKPKISVWFYHLIVVVHWVSLTWTLASCGVQAERCNRMCIRLDGKDLEN